MPRLGPPGIRPDRPLECRQVLADQPPDRPERAGQGLGHPRQDPADQFLRPERDLEPGRPAGLWLRPCLPAGPQCLQPGRRRLPEAAEEPLPGLRPDRLPPAPAGDRPRVPAVARRRSGALLPHLHQDGQGIRRGADAARRSLAGSPPGNLRGAAARARLLLAFQGRAGRKSWTPSGPSWPGTTGPSRRDGSGRSRTGARAPCAPPRHLSSRDGTCRNAVPA